MQPDIHPPATRCLWAKHPLEITYHDTEWGVPVYDDHLLFEHLTLDAFQAGVSWLVVLKKREHFRQAFAGFHPGRVAAFGSAQEAELLANPGIIRNRLKVAAAIRNAQLFLQLQREFGSFSNYIWQFVGGQPKVNGWTRHDQIPGQTPESQALSKDLKKRGFGFMGPTVVYAFMQAAGLVNDHLTHCPRFAQVGAEGVRE